MVIKFAGRAVPAIAAMAACMLLPGAAFGVEAAAAAAATAVAAASSEPAAAPAGTLVIVGGALRADNADVWSRIVALSGGPGARIAVLPTAAGNPARSGEQIAAALRRYGADPFIAPIAPRMAGSDYRQAAEDAALAQRIRQAGGVYFAGGDQGRITQALLRADGSRTAALKAMWDMYRRGGMVAGTSAGAAIMSTTMFDDAPPVWDALRRGLQPEKSLSPGLGFIGGGVFIDQHFLIRGRLARMVPAMMNKGYRVGFGVDENSALVVRQQRQAEVIGYKGVLMVDLSEAAAAPVAGAFGARAVKLSYLDHGDQLDLATGVHKPGPDKEAAIAAGDPPSNKGPLYSNDILGNNAVLDLMERLVDSDQQEAFGLASGDPRSTAPETAFGFRFTRTPQTLAYPSSTSSAYSIRDVRLDIVPLPMRRELQTR
ncbi:cyanophycinase [Pseudoduganella aquatica]|uniref:cyanophycinase n=1 Tax=Pseudoduganella aquatica TaxID=2660641 RepID=UPI001E47194F|nr:cyanophycinase [Pseudoduganella aquatica]